MADQTGNPTQLAQQYLPLLASIVREYCRRFPLADPDDVYQDGAVGLMQAARKCAAGVPLGPLARQRIRGAILDARMSDRAARHGLRVHTDCHESMLDRPAVSGCEDELDLWWADQLESLDDRSAMLLEAKFRFQLTDEQVSRLVGIPRRQVRHAVAVALASLYRQS